MTNQSAGFILRLPYDLSFHLIYDTFVGRSWGGIGPCFLGHKFNSVCFTAKMHMLLLRTEGIVRYAVVLCPLLPDDRRPTPMFVYRTEVERIESELPSPNAYVLG